MNFQIESFPNQQFVIWPGFSPLDINISQQVKAQLKPREELTNGSALRIFEQMKWKADLLSFLTKPVVSISLSALLFVGSLSITPIGAVAALATIIFASLSGGLLGYVVQNSFNGFLPKLSEAYANQSTRLNLYIAKLLLNESEANPKVFKFELQPRPVIFFLSCLNPLS